jgi:putative transposase
VKRESRTPRRKPEASRRKPEASRVTATGTQPLSVQVRLDSKESAYAWVMQAGLQVLQEMLEADRAAMCGPRYQHRRQRQVSRAGTTASEVVLGGRKVAIRRPRVRGQGQEVALPTFAALSATDPLTARAVEQMLVGVATRRYARSLEPLGSGVLTRGTSKSAVSRRFVAKTGAQLEAWRTRALDALDLVALFIDGVVFADHCVIVALGVDHTGRKHPLGLWSGSTENATICQALLANLRDRGLRTDRSLLVVIDGSKALRKAVRDTFGNAAWIQRCQVHKVRNVLAHLPKVHHARIRAALQRAYQCGDPQRARRLLIGLARQLSTAYPAAAASLDEGLDETVTVLELPVADRLRRSLATTNAIENVVGHLRYVHHHVKRWRHGCMVLRWAAAGFQEAAKGFRRIKGCTELARVVAALRQRDVTLGLSPTQEDAA